MTEQLTRISRWVALALAVLAAAPAAAAAGDLVSEPFILPLGPYLSGSNVGMGEEPGEPLECRRPEGTARMRSTDWMRIEGTGGPVKVTTAGSQFDSVLAVYEASGERWGRQLACNNDVASGLRHSSVTVDTARGAAYLIQVAGCASCGEGTVTSGRLFVNALGNDRSAFPTALPFGVELTHHVQQATTEPGEALSCRSQDFGRTAWYAVDAPARGRLAFQATGPRAVLNVVRPGEPQSLGCEAAEPPRAARVVVPVTQGRYLMQVGVRQFENQHVSVLADFVAEPGPEPADAAGGQRTPPSDPDRDDDGVQPPVDCDDRNPGIRPGAVDAPGDGVDQDCRGGDAAYPRVSSRIVTRYLAYRRSTRFSRLDVLGMQAGSLVTVRCGGRGCGFRSLSRRYPRAQRRVRLTRIWRRVGRRLPVGARLEVRVTRPGSIGVGRRLTVRGRRAPIDVELCFQPGSRRGTRC